MNFVGAPDPYSDSREEKVEDVLQYMKDVAWRLGWKYRITEREIQKLTDQ